MGHGTMISFTTSEILAAELFLFSAKESS